MPARVLYGEHPPPGARDITVASKHPCTEGNDPDLRGSPQRMCHDATAGQMTLEIVSIAIAIQAMHGIPSNLVQRSSIFYTRAG